MSTSGSVGNLYLGNISLFLVFVTFGAFDRLALCVLSYLFCRLSHVLWPVDDPERDER